MNQNLTPATDGITAIPSDELSRAITIAGPGRDVALPHVGRVGDTSTVLLSGKDTAGRYCLIDMHVPPCCGPGPHRHDFEEMFSVLEGEVEITLRGQKMTVKAGEMIDIPADAPHFFHDVDMRPARLLCMRSPAGHEEFFVQVGVPLASRTEARPESDAEAMGEFKVNAQALALIYRTERLRAT